MKNFKQHGLKLPRTLTLAITGDCNLACRHCWVRAGEASAPAHVPLLILHRLVEEFAAIGGDGIRITGGEPLCHPEWLDLLQFACSSGFNTVTLQTNAMLLTNAHVAALRKLDFPGLVLQISLDGVAAGTHDQVRGAGAFRGAMQGIDRLMQGGLVQRISIFFTEMRHNLAEIPELLALADSLGIGSVTSGSLVECGRAAETTLIEPPGVEQYLDLLERYHSDNRFRELYRKIGAVAVLEWQAGDTVRQECCTFVENPYLTPSGRLYPCLLCHCDDFSVTGVFEKGLAAAFVEGVPLWSSLLQVSRCRAEALPECRDCPGRRLCAGGCMGRSWGSRGSFLERDDRCEVRRAIYQRLVKSDL